MSYEDVVDMLVPELQKRGLMWKDYTVPGGTYRENLHNTPGNPYLNPTHPGSKYKWNAPKAEGNEAKSDIDGKTLPTEIIVPIVEAPVQPQPEAITA